MVDTLEAKPTSFPTWMYFKHPTRGLLSQLFDDETSCDTAHDAGWRSSPAAFNIETHPSNPVVEMVGSPMGAPVPGAGDLGVATANDIAEITAILTSLQAQLDTQAQRMTVLEELVGALSTPAEPPPPPPRTVPRLGPHGDEDDKPATPGRK